MKKVELLAPAGDLERLKIALLYGADAVYIGGKEYNLRANADNFSTEDIKKGCLFAHKLGKKIYLTLNIVFHDEDMEKIDQYISKVVAYGIDAFIVSDVSLISYIKENYPQVEVHLSTQHSTTNSEEIAFFKKQGVNRIVLARECNKEQIKKMVANNVDIEVFIHGAVCTCYSGRCALSNYVTNRDSNRGGCSQVCRFAFDVLGEDIKFTMATKDLNMARFIKDLIDIGVCSLKIEGRMRSLYYLATVIGSYRKLIDAYYDNILTDELIREQEKILNQVANRETSSHYFMREATWEDQYYTGRQELSNQDFLALVMAYDKKKKLITLSERNYFEVGFDVEIFMPSGKLIAFTIDNLYNSDMQAIKIARHPEEQLFMYFPYEVEKYSMMRLQNKMKG